MSPFYVPATFFFFFFICTFSFRIPARVWRKWRKIAGLEALPGACLAFIKYSRVLWKTSRGPARRGEGGHSNRRTSSASPLCLLCLSPYSYAPVSFSTTQALTVNICLISLLKSPLFPSWFLILPCILFLPHLSPTSNSWGPAGAPLLPDDSTTLRLYEGNAFVPPLPYVTIHGSQIDSPT